MADAVAVIRAAAHPLAHGPAALDALVERAGRARVIVLGAAAPGAAEHQGAAARLAARLVDDAALATVALDADSPDVEAIDAFVRLRPGAPSSAAAAAASLRRFPARLLAGAALGGLAATLRARNERRPAPRRVALVGLDPLRRDAVAEAALSHLAALDPDASQAVRLRLGEVDHVARTAAPVPPPRLPELLRRLDGLVPGASPERHETVLAGGAAAFSERARRLATSILELAEGGRVLALCDLAQAGDARASSRGAHGERSVGQLLRERLAGDVLLVGLTLHHGATLTASAWGGRPVAVRVRNALPASYEALLHATGLRDLALLVDEPGPRRVLGAPRPLRALGAVYRPEAERTAHYDEVSLPQHLDAVVHLDEVTAAAPP